VTAAAVPWSDGQWTHQPASVSLDGEALRAIAVEGSDAWRTTAYGFVHDDPHALLAPLAVGQAMEITFSAEWSGEFDQAGVFVRQDDEHWVKTGIEFADGHLGLGAVVTDVVSDWSVGYVDEWNGSEVTVRVSRWPDALIVRARAGAGAWRLVRVAPFDGGADAAAGPFLCAPLRSGFEVRFLSWHLDAADEKLH
jgi:regulation of enolase protein 1 (concanavalin A-like superfamily)